MNREKRIEILKEIIEPSIIDRIEDEKDKEIERLTKQNKALNEMYELTKKEYIRLNNIIAKNQYTADELCYIKELEDRIDKAIEYIKNNGCYCLCFDKYGCVDDLRPEECDELLKLLENGEKNGNSK